MTRAIWTQPKGYTMTILLDVTDQLPKGLVEVYGRIQAIANPLDISLLIVGATARDIILAHGFSAAIERGTRDIDFGIEVPSWSHYQRLRDALIAEGFAAHQHKTHQLHTQDVDSLPWEIDLIPFGGVSDTAGQITWPPEHGIAMSVLGFEEAYTHAWHVTLSQTPTLEFRVASPAGILLLKLIAWTERGRELKGKDAVDIYYLINHYTKIPDVTDRLYEEAYMDAQDYDIINASAMLLADELKALAHPLTLNYLRDHMLNDDAKRERLVTDISRYCRADFAEAETLVAIIHNRLSGQ